MTRMSSREDDDLVRKLRLIETSHAQAEARRRRWDQRRHISLSDVVVWTLFILACTVGILVACLLLILAWPTS